MEQIRNHWKQYAWIIGTIGILSGIAVVLRMISNQAPLPMATFILSFSATISVLVAQIYYGENLKPQQWLAVIFLIVGIFVISWIGDGQLKASHFFFQD
jgi:drug/metabolite transporter (DMT)-like permease